MANLKYSSAGLELTKQFEGCELTAYQDQVGVWTIGYGHTGTDVKKGLTITEEQASTLLAADVSWAVTCVNKSVKVAVNQNQFDAMVDFVFNLGCASFGQSTLLRLLNAGNFSDAAKEFLRWNRAGGKVVAGLTRRRQAEMALFDKPMATATPLRITAAAPVKKAAARRTGAKRPARRAALG
ncbi:MAG TPA: lysozyme [Edaphobacter sp.]|jgi:lysozyme|nr:lysozyme [Edaphobacter sp.]